MTHLLYLISNLNLKTFSACFSSGSVGKAPGSPSLSKSSASVCDDQHHDGSFCLNAVHGSAQKKAPCRVRPEGGFGDFNICKHLLTLWILWFLRGRVEMAPPHRSTVTQVQNAGC